MVTRIARFATANNEYVIQGIVVDRARQAGVRGVRVDAWDKDTKDHDLLGQVITADDGTFTIGFDSAYFGDFAPDHSPDLFFRVYLDGSLVLDTIESPMMNAPRGTTQVRLAIDLPAAAATTPDRVDPLQAIKILDWWHASDFRGVWTETKDKGGTLGKLGGALASTTLKNWDFAPVTPQGTREKDVVGQNQAAAQRSLALQQVEVTDVQEVGANGAASAVGTLRHYPATLRPGDKVVLYTQDGKVLYYTRVPAADASQVDGQTVVRIDGDVQTLKAQMQAVDAIRANVANLQAADGDKQQRLAADADELKAQTDQVTRLQSDLASLRQSNVDKDTQILKLQTDLATVRKAQDNLAARLPPLERLDALEAQLKLLQPATPKAVRATAKKGTPAAKAKPAVKAKTPAKPRKTTRREG